MKRSRIVSLFLALLMMLSVFTVASAEERPVLTLGVPMSSVVENWDTNTQTLMIEEYLNCDLVFVEFPSNTIECEQKVDMMVMAGGEDLPDALLFPLPVDTQVKYGELGMFVDLTDLYDGVNDPFFTEEAAKSSLTKEEILKYIACPNGKIYGMPYFVDSLDNSYANSRMLIYEPWLEKLGLEMPTNIDEFVDVLRAFKTEDPNGNGEADEIPLLGNIAGRKNQFIYSLMSPFIYTQEHNFMNVDGTVEFTANKDAWREGLMWIRSLVDEGLLSPLTFTQDFNQFKAIMTQEEVIVGVQPTNSSSYMPADLVRRIEYIIVEPLEGPEGLKQATVTPQLPSTKMYITKNCEDVLLAFRLGDYLCSELMSVLDRWGLEDIDWRYPVEGEECAYAAAGVETQFVTLTSKWGTMQNTWWGHVGPQMLLSPWCDGFVCDPMNHLVPLGRSILPMIEYGNKDNGVWGLIYTAEEQAVITEYQKVIDDYVMESLSRFVTRDLSLEEDWDTYVAELDAMGLAIYLETVQAAFDRA